MTLGVNEAFWALEEQRPAPKGALLRELFRGMDAPAPSGDCEELQGQKQIPSRE